MRARHTINGRISCAGKFVRVRVFAAVSPVVVLGVVLVFGFLSVAEAGADDNFFTTTVSYNVGGHVSVGGAGTSYGGFDLRQSPISTGPQLVTLEASIGQTVQDAGRLAHASATVSAQADLGVLRAGIHGITNGVVTGESQTGLGEIHVASVRSRFQDTAVMNAAGILPGQVVTIEGFFEVHGGFALNPSATAVNNIGVAITTTLALKHTSAGFNSLPTPPIRGLYFGEATSRQVGIGAIVTTVNNPPAVIPLTLHFIQGEPYTVDYTLELEGSASAGASVSTLAGSASAIFESDFSQTITWGGITRVISGGQTINDWTITSASGFNYANPAPEPASLSLLALAVLPMMRHRRRVSETGPQRS